MADFIISSGQMQTHVVSAGFTETVLFSGASATGTVVSGGHLYVANGATTTGSILVASGTEVLDYAATAIDRTQINGSEKPHRAIP